MPAKKATTEKPLEGVASIRRSIVRKRQDASLACGQDGNARCTIDYTGRGTRRLSEGARLPTFKPDGTVLVDDDESRRAKPLNSG
jgi:RecB family endonuclease NucS